MKHFSLFALCLLLLAGCGSSRNVVTTPQSYTIPLNLGVLPPSDIYINMDYGVRLNIQDKRPQTMVLNKYDVNFGQARPQISTYPDIKSFVSESMRKYMQTMGFDIDADINTDYMLQIEITQYQISYLSGMGWMGTICFDMLVYDESRNLVYPRTAITGRASLSGSPVDFAIAANALNAAYGEALENIDWDRVAYFLRRADSPSGEKNKQVTGSGDTALEHTIIRWFIDSSPKGADVNWRVVSSTPDVKNTNQNYLGTTPYESTESFDIKGLTFNNSGDVQIEISCEKAGYLTQKKRFNLRQAIEQKEISTKFNLVEE